MENKITELLLSTDKALKELYINFIQYKDAKKIQDLQEKNKINTEYKDYEVIKKELEDLQQSYDTVINNNSLVREKVTKLKKNLQEIINKDKLV